MIKGDYKGVNNRQVWFDSITSSKRVVIDITLLWLSHYIDRKYCAKAFYFTEYF